MVQIKEKIETGLNELVNKKRNDYKISIVGGGPTGIELALALRDLVEHRVEFHAGVNPQDVKISILQAPDSILAGFHPGIMRAVGPELVVISVGRNPFGHPHSAPMKDYQKAPKGVVRTDDGLVAVHVKKDGSAEFVQ